MAVRGAPLVPTQELEHDFVVAPRADPRQIVLSVDGAGGTRIDDSGDLIITLEEGAEVGLQKPVAWQETGRRDVPCRFRLLPGNHIGFEPESWDRNRPLDHRSRRRLVSDLGGSKADEAHREPGDPFRGMETWMAEREARSTERAIHA